MSPTNNSWNSQDPAQVSKGGTGADTFTAYAVLCGGTAATNPFQPIAGVGAATEVLTSNGAGALPTFQAAGGGGLSYAEEVGATKTIVIDYEYGANRGGGVAFALPATAAIGTRFAITGIAGLWSITQAANQYVGFAALTTTVGVGGSLTATNAGDCLTCTCIVADLGWRVTSAVGNITIV